MKGRLRLRQKDKSRAMRGFFMGVSWWVQKELNRGAKDYELPGNAASLVKPCIASWRWRDY